MTKKNNKMNPLTAAAVGAAVGAAAVLLSDKKTRGRLKEEAEKAKLKLQEVLYTGEAKLNEAKNKAEKEVQKGKLKLAKKLSDASGKVRSA
jgi:gas vesicle protein